jgi:hypothetical protein
MKFIPITATAVDRLRRRAKTWSKQAGVSPVPALDDVARAGGYETWKHVTACLEQTPASGETPGPLPEVLAQYLTAIAKATPPSLDSRQAFAAGLAFAFDARLIDGRLDDDVVFCDDAWPIAGADLLRLFAHRKESDDDLSFTERLAEAADLCELSDEVEDELLNWSLLRYTGTRVFATLDEAFAGVLGGFFFAPSYVWLGGRFHDMRKVPEVRVGARVVYATWPTDDGGRMRSCSSPGRDLKE